MAMSENLPLRRSCRGLLVDGERVRLLAHGQMLVGTRLEGAEPARRGGLA